MAVAGGPSFGGRIRPGRIAANAALELTRQKAADSVCARIDAASTPTITVAAPTEPEWPRLEPSGHTGGESQPIVTGIDGSPGQEPEGSAWLIPVRDAVTGKNESSVHTPANCAERVDQTLRTLGTVHLEPGRVVHPAWCAFICTVEDWIAVHRAR